MIGKPAPLIDRYIRQETMAELGPQGQHGLSQGKALLVGLGGLGSWSAQLLARAGVGMLRLVDFDRVDATNLARQAIYTEADAIAGRLKVDAAAEAIRQVRGDIALQALAERVTPANIAALAQDMDVIVDGTDSFDTRFLINDYAVKANRPWVFAGVVRCEAQTMTILPGQTPCLRCICEQPPPPDQQPRAAGVGVLGPAVAAIAAIQALEAVKILAGRLNTVNPYLTRLDLWTNAIQRLDLRNARRSDCPCCGKRRFEFLNP